MEIKLHNLMEKKTNYIFKLFNLLAKTSDLVIQISMHRINTQLYFIRTAYLSRA